MKGNYKLIINKLSKTFVSGDRKITAIKDVNINIRDKEFVSIVGPSGCGKTTLINLIAGLIKPSSGSIMLDGKKIDSPGMDRGVVFQNYTYFPWLTVLKNVEFGLKINNVKENKK